MVSEKKKVRDDKLGNKFGGNTERAKLWERLKDIDSEEG